MKRHYIAVVFAVALALPGGAPAQGEKQASSDPKPSVEIIEMRHNLGKIFEREKYEHTFTVRNRGNADLIIEDVKPG